MKKAELAMKICRAVGVEREHRKLPFLSWREMLYVLSWLVLADDVKKEVEERLLLLTEQKQAQKKSPRRKKDRNHGK